MLIGVPVEKLNKNGIMPFDGRRKFIIQYLQDGPRGAWVDVLNRDFVDAYVEHTNAKIREQLYGADTCPMLGRDLAKIVKQGSLRRTRQGIEGMAGMRFPRWCYIYQLP